ncbi:MAG TPA: hypothetical protein VFL51_13050 [Pseudolabrys sp.]|nr:hypothetical protein [Pseudolabrys sp.]
MTNDAIPDDVRDFILRHIDSIAQLEALLLLRANREKGWDVGSVAARLYSNDKEIEKVLTRLCEDGLLSCKDGLYRYECAPAMEESVSRLADAYRRHLIPVTNVIHAKSRRIREFADAFKIRKDS